MRFCLRLSAIVVLEARVPIGVRPVGMVQKKRDVLLTGPVVHQIDSFHTPMVASGADKICRVESIVHLL